MLVQRVVTGLEQPWEQVDKTGRRTRLLDKKKSSDERLRGRGASDELSI
jgi:hypothetical protein